MKEALSSPEKRKWMKAMESEINSLNTNQVWDLAELPCGRKAIGSGFSKENMIVVER